MATLKKYVVFKNEVTGEIVKASTHKWTQMRAAGYAFVTPAEEQTLRDNGTHPDSIKVDAKKTALTAEVPAPAPEVTTPAEKPAAKKKASKAAAKKTRAKRKGK